MNTEYYYQKIKRGHIIKKIKSIKLREDIPCDISECTQCDEKKNILSVEQPILFLTASLIITQMDAIENYDIIDNCIIPQSEYNIIMNKHEDIYKRLNYLIEQRNILIYPNEYSYEIANFNNQSINKKDKKFMLLQNTLLYYIKHIGYITDNFSVFLIKGNNEDYMFNQLNKNTNFGIYDLFSYAKEKLNENPDLYNYISFSEETQKNAMDIDNNIIYSHHLTENEMKTNIKSAIMFQGKINFKPDIYNKAYINCPLFNKDIIIEGDKNINRAMHGDIVCFSIFDENKWIKSNNENYDEIDDGYDINNPEIDEKQIINIKQKINTSDKTPVGKVEGILRNNKSILCGTIYNPDSKLNTIPKELVNIINDNTCIFIPIDNKFPLFKIQLYKKDTYYNQRIVVKYDGWNEYSILPSVHFIKKLGKCFEVTVENEIILYEHNVDINPFSQKIINSMPKEDTEFICEEEELKKRMDLRKLNVCSIDPPGCKDIDDALSCEILPNKNYQVGVHIADVTHYIKPNSEVDKIASKNCNTVYLVHRRTDMLPKVLTENLCSLVGGKERLAYSVLWEFDKNTFEILDVKYGKSVIKSKAALCYEKANDMMNDINDKSELTEGIRRLNKIAKHLKQERLKKGALILASNEMKFNVNTETNTINDICLYPTYETNSLVEEFMLLANVWVAKKIYENFPACSILRRHPPPKQKELSEFIKLMNDRGYTIDATNSTTLGQSLENINNPNDPFFNKLIRSLVTRTMNQAKYFPSGEFCYEDFYHYGLAMDIYTHFTSPIRRYSDILVHRLLSAALEIDYLPSDMSNKYKSNKQCNQMNKQNRVSFFCGKDSNYFSAFLFFDDINRDKEKSNVDIIIHSIDDISIKGISTKYGIESNILFDSVGGIKYIDTIKHQFELNNGDIIKLFDHINVQIITTKDNYRYQIKYIYLNKSN